MKHSNKLWFCLLLCTGLFFGCNSDNLNSAKETEAEVVKIGAILPLTGPGAELAQYIKEGIDMAVSEINEKDSSLLLEVLYEDSKTQPKDGVSAFRKLMSFEKPLASIVALSSVARATYPIAVESNSLVVYTAVAVPGVSDGTNTFRVYPEANGLSGIMAEFISNNLNLKRAAVIYINDDFGRSSLEVFQSEFEAMGGEVVFGESYEMLQADYKTQIAKIRSLSTPPDVIYMNGYGPAYGMILKQLKESGLDAVITADMTMGLPNTQKLLGELSEGIYFVDGEMSASFVTKFQDSYSKMPTSYAGYSYDIVQMLYLSLLNPEGKRTTEGLGMALKKLDYSGAMGQVEIATDGESNLQFVVKQMKGGKPSLVK